MRTDRPAGLRLGTRGSALTRRQTNDVCVRLRDTAPHVTVKSVAVSTTGDRLDRPLSLHDIDTTKLATTTVLQVACG